MLRGLIHHRHCEESDKLLQLATQQYESEVPDNGGTQSPMEFNANDNEAEIDNLLAALQ